MGKQNKSLHIVLPLIKINKMSVDIVTKEDLTEFRHQLLEDLKTLINSKVAKQKEWLKSSEVRRLLKISPGTLQNFRVTGILSFTKIGGIFFYNNNDIETLLDKNKIVSVLEKSLVGKIDKNN